MQRLVAVGASTGGFQALTEILGRLPVDFSGSVAIVQHRRADESSMLRELLAQRTRLPVIEPCHGTPLRPGHVYIAPPDYHLLVEPGLVALSIDPPINLSRPSIDALFDSAAVAYRHRAIGVVLTGANADGAQGAQRLARARAPLIVQDPATAEAAACPAAALERVPNAIVLSLPDIADRLIALCSHPGAGD
jgi:two-component system, chemotaxis family, protein-glutamate methylesterase/glutaminase